MKCEKNKNIVIIWLSVLVILLSTLCILFANGIIKLNNKELDNSNQNLSNKESNNNKNLNTNMECTKSEYTKLEILPIENKTGKILGVGGSENVGYNFTTTATRNHDYTSIPKDNELYAIDYSETLFVLYKNKLYYTLKEEVFLKYCNKSTSNYVSDATCDYSKFNDNTIKEFNEINIKENLKAIGSYGSVGSGAPNPYAITTDGKVIIITSSSSYPNNYNACEIIYDSSDHPIDRVFNMVLQYGLEEYTILLKDGTLITKDIDREHLIYEP